MADGRGGAGGTCLPGGRLGGATVAALVACLLGLAALAAAPSAARAEAFLDLYMGKSFTLDSDLRISQPSQGDEFEFLNLSWSDRSFTSPPYYGARAGYFFESHPWLGLALEFFHFKIIADTAEIRRLTGVHRGNAVDARVPVDSVVQSFQITHGVNYLTVDAMFRYPLLRDPVRFPRGRVHLYSGFGVGPVIAHPESIIDGASDDGPYQVGGIGAQVFLGARALLFKHVGVFAEYKFSHSSLDVEVARGTAYVTENTHHIVWGITIAFPSF